LQADGVIAVSGALKDAMVTGPEPDKICGFPMAWMHNGFTLWIAKKLKGN
jgi:hypothetical protein